MMILKMSLEEQLLIKYCTIRHLINNAKNPEYDGCYRGMASKAYKDKKWKGAAATYTIKFPTNTFSGAATREIMSNPQLASMN